MNDNPVRRAVIVLLGLCVVILMVGTVYYVAEYRAQPKTDPPTMAVQPMMFHREPIEGRGFEGMFTQQGLLVTTVDGRGRLMGLQPGDIIKSANGQQILSPAHLRAIPAGAQLLTERQGQRLMLTIPGRPDRNAMGIPGNPRMQPVEARTIDVRGLEGQLTADGVWVNTVDGEAARWGLRAGDLIRSINGQPLTVQHAARATLRALDPASGFVFEIVRGGSRVYLPFNMAAAAAAAPVAAPVAVPANTGTQQQFQEQQRAQQQLRAQRPPAGQRQVLAQQWDQTQQLQRAVVPQMQPQQWQPLQPGAGTIQMWAPALGATMPAAMLGNPAR